MGDFKALKVWQQGMDIAEKCIKLVADFPKDAVFNLGEQIKRSAISIPSNIAEGNSRTSNKEYFHFLSISLGSCFELETQLLLAQRTKFGNSELLIEVLDLIDRERKMLISLRMKVRDSF